VIELLANDSARLNKEAEIPEYVSTVFDDTTLLNQLEQGIHG
jgi:hypothetical protein